MHIVWQPVNKSNHKSTKAIHLIEILLKTFKVFLSFKQITTTILQLQRIYHESNKKKNKQSISLRNTERICWKCLNSWHCLHLFIIKCCWKVCLVRAIVTYMTTYNEVLSQVCPGAGCPLLHRLRGQLRLQAVAGQARHHQPQGHHISCRLFILFSIYALYC